jgi:hypothetical protein
VAYGPAYPFGEHRDSVWMYLTADVADARVADLYGRIITPPAASQVVGPTSFGIMKGVEPQLGLAHGSSVGTHVSPPTCR